MKKKKLLLNYYNLKRNIRICLKLILSGHKLAHSIKLAMLLNQITVVDIYAIKLDYRSCKYQMLPIIKVWFYFTQISELFGRIRNFLV